MPSLELKTALTTEQAFEIQERIKTLTHHTMEIVYMLGDELIAFREGLGHIALGYDSFDDWVSQPDIAIGRASAFLYMKLARLRPKLQHLSPTFINAICLNKMKLIAPKLEALNDPEAITEIMHTALVNSTSNLRAIIHDRTEAYGTALMGVEKATRFVFDDAKVNYDVSYEGLFKTFAGRRVRFHITVIPDDEEK